MGNRKRKGPVFKGEWLQPPEKLTNDQLGALKHWLKRNFRLMPHADRDRAKLLLDDVRQELSFRRTAAREMRAFRRKVGFMNGTPSAAQINLDGRRAWLKVPHKNAYVARVEVGGQVGWLRARLLPSGGVNIVGPICEPQGVHFFRPAGDQIADRIERELPVYVAGHIAESAAPGGGCPAREMTTKHSEFFSRSGFKEKQCRVSGSSQTGNSGAAEHVRSILDKKPGSSYRSAK